MAAAVIRQQKTRLRVVGAEQLPKSSVINAETRRSAIVVLLATRLGLTMLAVGRRCVPRRVGERRLLREEQQSYETEL